VWEISLHAEVEAWFLDLCTTDSETADLVAEAIDLLAEQGPALAVHSWIGYKPVGSTT
jgi:hypothetical protein